VERIQHAAYKLQILWKPRELEISRTIHVTNQTAKIVILLLLGTINRAALNCYKESVEGGCS
jgi:hypothetical protein